MPCYSIKVTCPECGESFEASADLAIDKATKQEIEDASCLILDAHRLIEHPKQKEKHRG
jgi:phage terminase large subunit GpA-like protein